MSNKGAAVIRRKRCVFSTANDDYIPNTAVSLLSFARHNPGVDMFILCSKMSDESAELCRSCDITLIEIDIADEFYKEWDYPRECYYHFKGPELFYSMGYDQSVYIDGDTYCNGLFPYESATDVHISGSTYGKIGTFFTAMGEYDKIVEYICRDDCRQFNRFRLQTGVLLYDNRLLSEFDFFCKAARLYDLSVKSGIPRKGDDSLLALMMLAYPEIATEILPRACNYIDFESDIGPRVQDSDDVILSCVIYHFVHQKPWTKHDRYPSYAHKYFREKWIERMINGFPEGKISRYFPDFFSDGIVQPDDVPFYWYTGRPNFGDWITPYLVERECGRKLDSPVDPLSTSSTVLLSTGSIMRLSGQNTIVWGSGIRDRFQDISPPKLARSVRGPITRRRILETGGECPPIYGDPALLLPRFYTPLAGSDRYKLGIAPHISQYEKVRALYAGEPGVAVLDLRTTDIERVVDAITACGAVVSSSLHGIVVANAYNIPVRWIKFDTNIYGDDTKFHDHFASIGRRGEQCIDAMLYQKLPVETLLREITPYHLDIDLDRLWDAGIFHNGEVSRYIRSLLSECAPDQLVTRPLEDGETADVQG